MNSPFQVVTAGEDRRRKMRYPNFPIAGTMRPYGLYPLWSHLVLPGETLTKVTTRFRGISQPINHPLAGTWVEFWYVYVKLTDIDEDLGNMFISDSYSTTGFTFSGDEPRYFGKSGEIAWTKLATEHVHNMLFLDEGETAKTIDGVRKVKMSNVSWAQNMIFEQANEVPGTTDIGELGAQYQYWQMMQQMSMSEITYEDYLKQYGVQSIRKRSREPEVLRYARKWTLPKNSVDPATGSPASAWIAYEDVELGKDKRFDEPGFIVCLATYRPKLYQKHLISSMLGQIWGFSDFFPAYNLSDPSAGAKVLSTSASLFHADHRTDVGNVDLVYDHRDLLSHGEQFVNNFSGNYPAPTSAGMLAQDASTVYDLRGQYADDTSIDALFVGTPTVKGMDYEGMASVTIKGHITDTTR